ncbi:MAG: helix-turn-helix transcriptional regulator [Catenulispora sp.]|nr:helix-turn-helix transcriptional regulator [Catenulispora sp.]
MTRIPVRVYAEDSILDAGVTTHLRTRPEVEVLPDAARDPRPAAVDLVVAETLDEPTLHTLRRLQASVPGVSVLLIGRMAADGLPAAAACGVRALLYRQLATPDRIVAAVVAAAKGEGVMPGDLLGDLLAQVGKLHQQVLEPNGLTVKGLTKREAQILELASQGYDTAGIARRAGFSERTVKTLLHGVVVRYGLRNRTHAVAHAIREGLV